MIIPKLEKISSDLVYLTEEISRRFLTCLLDNRNFIILLILRPFNGQNLILCFYTLLTSSIVLFYGPYFEPNRTTALLFLGPILNFSSFPRLFRLFSLS